MYKEKEFVELALMIAPLDLQNKGFGSSILSIIELLIKNLGI